jgi:Mrp family chromosome partitioning ATPase
MQDIVFRDQATGVDYCFTAGNKSVPQTLLASERMQALLEHARQLYDYVILDSPPLMAVSDALVLAPQMDYVVYAARYDKTPRKVIKNALRQLAYGARSYAGCVLTQVDLKRHARYDYGDAGYYYGRYGNYYEGSKG